MLQECDNSSDAEDDSEGKSNFVSEDEAIFDNDCHRSERGDPEQ